MKILKGEKKMTNTKQNDVTIFLFINKENEVIDSVELPIHQARNLKIKIQLDAKGQFLHKFLLAIQERSNDEYQDLKKQWRFAVFDYFVVRGGNGRHIEQYLNEHHHGNDFYQELNIEPDYNIYHSPYYPFFGKSEVYIPKEEKDNYLLIKFKKSHNDDGKRVEHAEFNAETVKFQNEEIYELMPNTYKVHNLLVDELISKIKREKKSLRYLLKNMLLKFRLGY